MTPNGTSAATERSAGFAGGRVDAVDYAKGICIVMVVMMHSVLGVEKAADQTGFMHMFVMFAKPFRMPDFFLISGNRGRLEPGWLALSGILHRAIRDAVVHLFAAGIFHRHKTDT
jgi:Acyltransferase family